MFTEAQLKEMQQKGQIRGYSGQKPVKAGISPAIKGNVPVIETKPKIGLKAAVVRFCLSNDILPVPPKLFAETALSGCYSFELVFSQLRKFRFDMALTMVARPNRCGMHRVKIGIEYEGILQGFKGHTSPLEYTKDCDKYNLAQIEGWIVLRYTKFNYQNVTNDLQRIIHGNVD